MIKMQGRQLAAKHPGPQSTRRVARDILGNPHRIKSSAVGRRDDSIQHPRKILKSQGLAVINMKVPNWQQPGSGGLCQEWPRLTRSARFNACIQSGRPRPREQPIQATYPWMDP